MTETKKPNLFALTWPIFIELVLQMLMGNIDQIMISKYSQTAVAAVGNANPSAQIASSANFATNV